MRVILVHWKAGPELDERAVRLRALGHRVEAASEAMGGAYERAMAQPPDAIVIDLGRLPSHGRQIAIALRERKATRHVPLVFVGGEPEKVGRLRADLPDAVYATWRGIKGALTRAVKSQPASPVVYRSTSGGARRGERGAAGAYSGTPLPKKLGVKPAGTLALLGAPKEFAATLGELPPGVKVTARARGPADTIVLFAKAASVLERSLPAATGALGPKLAVDRLAQEGLGRRQRPRREPRARAPARHRAGRHQGLRHRRDLVGAALPEAAQVRRAARVLAWCLLLAPLPAQDAPAPSKLDSKLDAKLDAKLDEGIAGASGKVPVFVRMRDQVFPRGGDYEKFCAANEGKRRSELRQRLLGELQAKSNTSWQAIASQVEALVEKGEVAGVARRWIVNGFFCEATAQACAKLAARDDVAFVYRQRVEMQQATASPRRRADRSAAALDRQRDLVRSTLEAWRDDGKEPFSADGLTIPWNLPRVNAPAAWPQATGTGVTVAVLDSGLQVSAATATALWRNAGEELDGKDNDGNGYVDDVFGWDFLANDNCPLGDPSGHGTACAGIIAGRPAGKDNTVTGVAPRARLMPLRGTGRLEAYEYALRNGADVLSMSYMWVNQPLGNFRGLYRLAHEHLAAAGVVAVGGAGNFERSAPKGQQIALPKDIPCVIAAAGIVESGGKGGPSSEGPCTWSGVWGYDDFPASAPLLKPDVTGCFGGFPVWAPPGRMRERFTPIEVVGDVALVVGPQGNSFAGPHAAGVAALVLSVAPELPAWRVKSILESTCAELGAEGRDVVFGAGLLQADRAVEMARELAPLFTRRKE